MRFSTRTAWDLSESPLAQALRARRATGLPLHDLTASNPTQCGFAYNEADILAPLSGPAALTYDPDPRGLLSAREGVSRYYASHGAFVPAEQLILTTSTSEAYSFLFRLLCDSGDEVLLFQPSYPLFDFLAQIDDVRLVPSPLFYDHGWQIDLTGLQERVTSRTRAIAVVHPNNPTGHCTRVEERRALETLCAERRLALIVDEVFLDYPFPGYAPHSFADGDHPALTFVLSGISKIAALPQMKAAWIAVFGPERERSGALARLEIIADTFLSMNAPVQNALPAWLAGSAALQLQIRARTQANLQTLDGWLDQHPAISRLTVEAGWYAVLRLPALEKDEELAIRLIADHGVSVHPGYFFGFPGDGWFVVSLLTPEDTVRKGLAAMGKALPDFTR